MTSGRTIVVSLLVVVFMAMTVGVSAQRRERQRFNYSEMIAKIMENAGCPLTEAQLKAVEKVQPGPDARKRLDRILTDPQKSALDKNEHERLITSIIRTLGRTDNPVTPEQEKVLQSSFQNRRQQQ